MVAVEFSPQGVRAAVQTPGGVDAMVEEAVRANVRDSESRDRILAKAAFATHAMVLSGRLFGDRKTSGALTFQEYADLFGLRSKGNVTLWRTVGHALVEVEIAEDSQLYRLLTAKGAGTHPAVRNAILAPGATRESVAEAVHAHFTPSGRKRSDALERLISPAPEAELRDAPTDGPDGSPAAAFCPTPGLRPDLRWEAPSESWERYDWEWISTQLMARPAEWALVFERDRITIVDAIMQGDVFPVRTTRGFEVHAIAHEGEHPQTCTLYVRWNPTLIPSDR